jgi:hypothetical protein
VRDTTRLAVWRGGIVLATLSVTASTVDQISIFLHMSWSARFTVAIAGAAIFLTCIKKGIPKKVDHAAELREQSRLESAHGGFRLSDEQIYAYVEVVWGIYARARCDVVAADTPSLHQHDRQKRRNASTDRAFALYLFARLLIDNKCIVEATEDVEIVGDVLRKSVTLEIHPYERLVGGLDVMSIPPDTALVVPILRKKGQSFDAFEVTDSSGERRTPLPLHITYGLLAFTIMDLFDRLLHEPDSEAVFSEAEQDALYNLTRLICSDEVYSEDAIRAEFDAAVECLDNLRSDARKRLYNFCRYFAHNTIVAVPLQSPDEPLWVRFTEILHQFSRLATPKDRLRTRVGLWPYRYQMELSYPFLAARYNLRFLGPPSQFVYRHFVRDGSGKKVTSETKPRNALTIGTTDARIEVAPELGLPHTTVSIRGLNRADPRRLEYAVLFEEIPPGALGRTILISAACTVLVGTFAFVMPYVNDGMGIDLAALLLALPLFAATWIGQSAERVQQSSLTALFGLAVSGGMSLAASLLYLIQSATWQQQLALKGITLVGAVEVPPIDRAWACLFMISASTTLWLVRRYRHRSSRYMNKLRNRSLVSIPDARTHPSE